MAREICLNQFFVRGFVLFYLCKHQPAKELYSGCFVTSGYREIIIFVKMAIPMKYEVSQFFYYSDDTFKKNKTPVLIQEEEIGIYPTKNAYNYSIIILL